MNVPEIHIPIDDQHHWAIQCWDEQANTQVSFALEDLRHLWHALGQVVDRLDQGLKAAPPGGSS